MVDESLERWLDAAHDSKPATWRRLPQRLPPAARAAMRAWADDGVPPTTIGRAGVQRPDPQGEREHLADRRFAGYGLS